jgi:hypothetical protein
VQKGNAELLGDILKILRASGSYSTGVVSGVVDTLDTPAAMMSYVRPNTTRTLTDAWESLMSSLRRPVRGAVARNLEELLTPQVQSAPAEEQGSSGGGTGPYPYLEELGKRGWASTSVSGITHVSVANLLSFRRNDFI